MEEGMIPSGESGYLRTIDRKALEDTPAGERFSQPLVTTESGAEGCAVNFIRTPPGGGSPEGLHTHLFDQVFYIVGGTMSIQVAEQQFSARAGDVVVFPRGVPHRNWNAGEEETVHLAINAPAPVPGQPFTIPA